MTVLGTAEILIVPVSTGFEAALKKETAPAFSKAAKDAEIAGADIGANLRGGVRKESGKLAADLEKDGASAGAGLHKGMSGGLSKLATAVSAAGLPLGGLSTGLEKSAKASEHLGASSGGLSSTLDRVGKVALIGVVGGFAAAAAGGVHLAEGMQSADTAIAAASGTSVAAATKIGDAFLTTGGKTEFTAQEMAKAYAGVAGQLKATEGHVLSSAEAMKVMGAADDLATAKQIDLGDATSSVAGIMQAFGLKTTDAAAVSDTLFAASTATGQSVDGLTNALEKARSKLGETSGPVSDLAGLLVDMTKQGITGRAAFGALNSGMTSLLKPAKAAADEQKKLGLEVFDSKGKFMGLGSVIDQLHPKFAGMTQQQQLATASTLFGAGAARQMLAVINAGPAAYTAATRTVSAHGQAQSAAAKQATSLHVEEKVLGAEVSDLGTRFGQILIPVLTAVIGWFVKATTFVTEHKGALIALGAVVTGILGPAIAVFTINKMAAFGKSFADASGHVKSFASDVEGVVSRVQTAFGKQNAAASKMATVAETSSAAAGTAAEGEATAVEGASTAVEGANTTAGASFAAEATEAGTASAAVDTAVAAEAAAVATADTAIEAENAAAAASFTGLLAAAGSVLGPAAVAGGVIVGAGALAHLLGGAGGAGNTSGVARNQPTTGLSPRLGSLGIGAGAPGVAPPTLDSVAKSVGVHWGGKFAGGGIVDTPTLAIVGDAGKELILPTAALQAQVASAPSHSLALRTQMGASTGWSPGQNAVAQQVMAVLTQGGLSQAGAAGMVGNWMQESSLNPSEPGGMLAQWLGSRLSALTGRYGSNPSAGQQASFALSELQGMPGLLAMLRTTNDPRAAALAISQQYERPLASAANNPNREGSAAAAFAAFGGGSALPSGAPAVQAVQAVALTAQQKLAAARTALTGTIQRETAAVAGQIAKLKGELAPSVHATVDPKTGKFTTTRTPVSATTRTDVEGQIAALKGALQIQIAQQKQALGEQTSVTKAQLTRQTTDVKAGASELSRLVAAVHNDKLGGLNTALWQAHLAGLGTIEKRLDHDHSTALATLSKELVAVHKQAMQEVAKLNAQAAKAALDATLTTVLTKNATDVARTATDQARIITEQTKLTLDQQAEAGLHDQALAAAQAQTSLDQITLTNDNAISAAQAKVDAAVNGSALQQAVAANTLAQAQAAATVQEAQAQSVLALAQAAAQAAANGVSTGPTGDPGRTPATPSFNFTILGQINANDLMGEAAWAIKTGALPSALPTVPAHA